MKSIIVVLYLQAGILMPAVAQSYQDYSQKAIERYRENDLQGAYSSVLKAIELGTENHWDYYNAALFATYTGDYKNAFKWIRYVLSAYPAYYNEISFIADESVQVLKKEQEWAELFSEAEMKYNPELERLLAIMFKEDQEVRTEYFEIFNKYGPQSSEMDSIRSVMVKSDSSHCRQIEDIFDQNGGWVSADKVGYKACESQFLILQHAPPDFQIKHFHKVRRATKRGDLQTDTFALLVDRVRLFKGKKQLYGTQISYDSIENKRYLALLKNPDKVNKRREKMGFDTSIEEYLLNYGLDWDTREYRNNIPYYKGLRNKKLK